MQADIRESVLRLFKDSKGFKSATSSKLRQHRMRGHRTTIFNDK